MKKGAVTKRARSALAVVGAAAIAVGSSAVAGVPVAASVSTSAVVVNISPEPGRMVGIAQPVMVRFGGPVADRTSAERGIIVDSPMPVPRRFVWLGDRVVEWQLEGFWPGSTRPGLAGSKRGFLHSNAKSTNVNVNADVARINTNDIGTGRLEGPPTPCARTAASSAPVTAGLGRW